MSLPQPKGKPTALLRISIVDENGSPQPRYIRASRVEVILPDPGKACPTWVCTAPDEWTDNTLQVN